METQGSESLSLQGMFSRRADPYEGADLRTSQRVVGAMLALATLLGLAFAALDPPNAALGWPGWAIAAALLVASGLGAWRLLDRERGDVSFNLLLVVAYAGLGQVALLVWLAGGGASAHGVLLFALLAPGVVHPPRRAFPHLAALLAVAVLPLLYGPADSGVAVRIGADALMLAAIGSIMIAYLHRVRTQRTELKKGVEVARRLARVDELTGLGNRRAFDEALTLDVADAERGEEILSVGLIDLDGFKSINDRFGHLEGDRTLCELGRALEAAVRSSDRCFRWAGDEFAVLLPGADRETALRVLDRVAGYVEDRVKLPDGSAVKMSFGAGQLVPTRTPEDLLALADVDLLAQKEGKAAGR